MKKNSLKTLLCILSPVFVALFIIAGGYPKAELLFMNGEISAQHSYMEKKCGQCHIPWGGVTDKKCIKCHIDDKHYLVKDTSAVIAKKLRCFDCHQEHRGRTYNIEAGEQFGPELQRDYSDLTPVKK